MKRRALFGVVTTAMIGLYAAVSLWPFEFHGGSFANGAELLSGGEVRFSMPGIVLIEGSPAWVGSAMRSNRLQLAMRMRSSVPEQLGPARILTFSLNPYERNLTVAQDGSDLVIRLRTASTDKNGMIDGNPVARVPRFFLKSDWIDLLIAVEPQRLRVRVGDEPIIDEELPLRPLETWDPSYRLALGNELTGDRPWIGEIGQVAVQAGHSKRIYHEIGRLSLPDIFFLTMKPPELTPLYQMNPKDAIENILLYVPLGFVFSLLLGVRKNRGRWVSVLGVLICVAAVSGSMEFLQFFVPLRAPSIDDVIFNTLGGGLGLTMAVWAPGVVRGRSAAHAFHDRVGRDDSERVIVCASNAGISTE